jgi:hypothetical protein
MNSTEHSPLPWSLATLSDNKATVLSRDEAPLFNIPYPEDKPNGWCMPREKADAEFVIRAVNAHDELVNTLEAIRNDCQEQLDRGDMDFYDLIEGFRSATEEALAKAKGQP